LGSVAGIWTEHAGVLEQRGERRLMKLDAEKCTPYLLDGTGGRLFASSSGLGGRGGGLSDGRGVRTCRRSLGGCRRRWGGGTISRRGATVSRRGGKARPNKQDRRRTVGYG